MTAVTDSRARLTSMRNGALHNPDHPVYQKVNAGRLVVVFQPIRNPVTLQVDKRAMRDAIPSMLYVYTLEHEGGVTALNREADVLALLDGESLETVQRRRAEAAGDPFAAVQRGLPGYARGG